MIAQPRYTQEELLKLARDVERAMDDAVEDAALQHVREGLPMAIWEDEQVKWLSPEEIAATLRTPRSVPNSPVAPPAAG